MKEIPIPQFGPDEVLVKVEATPINPSDEYFAKDVYGLKEALILKPPFVPGFEGSGVIVKLGANVPKEMLNLKCSFCTDPHNRPIWSGTWAQYVAIDYRYCFPIGDLPFEDACCFFVNPVTIMAFLLEMNTRQSQGIVHTAACSSLGKMLVKVCNKKGVELINIVRKPEQEKILKDLGAKYVLNQNDPKFVQNLAELTRKLKITVCFDACAGALSGQLLEAMPPKSTVFVYGSLSMSLIGSINPKDLLFEGKKLEGFWMKESAIFQPAKIGEAVKFIMEDLMTGGKLFKPIIAKQISLQECSEYINGYKKYATQGKTIFRPNMA
jgi:NADPH:quinone reductase-like Zn-dependent oxidoreductase